MRSPEQACARAKSTHTKGEDRHSLRDHLFDRRRGFPIPQLAHVEVALGPVGADGAGPAEEDVALGLHQVLPGDHAHGFASLDGNERLEMLYVHPAAAGLGVGTMLVDALEKLAAARGAKRLTAEVSDSAHDFFKARGFVAQQRNTVTVGDEWLANTTMQKQLAAKERAP